MSKSSSYQPFFPNAKASWITDSNDCILLEVEFSSHGKIASLQFHLPPSLEESLGKTFLSFEKKARNLTLHKALALPREEKSFLPLCHWLVLRAYENWMGDVPRWEDGREELICRCFGVSAEKIKTFCEQNPNPTLEQAGDHLRAGLGCTSCKNDLRKILVSNRSPQSPPPEERVRIGEKSPLEVMAMAHEVVQNFFEKRQQDHSQDSLEVCELKGHWLYFRYLGSQWPSSWIVELEEELALLFREELVLLEWG